MKTRLLETTALTFTPRNVCFAEADAGDDGAPAGGGMAHEGEAEELVLDDDAPAPNEGEADDDSDELEIGPQKYRVPKPVKEAWNGVQKSTQAEKEAVKAKERELEEAGKRYQENMRIASTYMKEVGRIQAIDEQLTEYEKLTPQDWMAWAEQDSAAANKAQIGLNALRSERDKLVRSVNEKEGTIKSQREREERESAEKAEREVAARIKDWSPAKKEALMKLATDSGVPAEIVNYAMRNPVLVGFIDEVRQFREAKARAAAVKQQQRADEPKPEPITRTRGTSGSSTSLGDNVSTENWAERFKKQRAVHIKARLR